MTSTGFEYFIPGRTFLMLTLNEKELIADVLNGIGMLLDSDPNYMDMMIGSIYPMPHADAGDFLVGAQARIRQTGLVRCGLEHEIYDAINLNQLDKKSEVDGAVLLDKIAQMTPAERRYLIEGMVRFWALAKGPDFLQDLEV